MNSKNALIIAYSRPLGVFRLLESLKKNKIENIYISIDGPRNDVDKSNQQQIMMIISEFSKNSNVEVYINRSLTNLGVAGGVLSAIDWFFDSVQEGLILEDDLEVGDDFYRFALDGLNTFKDNSNVWMIAGTQLIPNKLGLTCESWSNYPMIWGWASWAEKWILMRTALLQKKRVPISQLTNHRFLFWSTGANRALDGKVDTWDIPLAYEFWRQNKFCIIPPSNLISNVGDDLSSTHTSSDNLALRQVIQALPENFRFHNAVSAESVSDYNLQLEDKVFHIRKRHILLPYHALLLDWLRFPRKRRMKPLHLRSDWSTFKAP